IEENRIVDHVFIEQAGAGSDNGLAAAGGVPCDANLRREVQIWIVQAATGTGNHGVELRSCREVGADASGIAHIAEAKIQRKVWPHLPAITHIQCKTMVRSHASG